jgi:hypothetical protein
MKETRKVKPFAASKHEATVIVKCDLSGYMLRENDAGLWLMGKAFDSIIIDVQSGIRPKPSDVGIISNDTKTRSADTAAEKAEKWAAWERELGEDWLKQNDNRVIEFTVEELFEQSKPKPAAGAKTALSAIDAILQNPNMSDIERVAAIMALREKK